MIKKQIKSLKSEVRNKAKKFKKKYDSVFGNNNYQKFIIIASGRTGSNLLISYLNSHPNIEAKGELFRDMQGKSCLEVWKDFYSPKIKNIKTAGFKIFYTHPFNTEDKTVWEYILKDPEIKIIHLVRENKLRTYLSLEIANKTDEWLVKKNKKSTLEEKQIKIDFDSFYTRVKDIEKYENETRIKYKKHNFIELSYEELVNDKDNTMKGIFNFLQVKENKFKSSLRKQNKESVKDLITNYDEFANKVKKTEFAYLLDLEN